MASSRVLGDVGLALLGVVTAAAAGYVLLRDPLPSGTDSFQPAVKVNPSPSASATVTTRPTATALDVLVLRSADTPAAHVVEAGRTLGWRLSGATLDAVPEASLLAQQEIVLVQAGPDDREQVQQAVTKVRAGAPAAQVVVLAPLTGPAVGRQLAVQGARTQLLDPVALGWLEGVEVADGGSLTPQGAQSVGQQLAAELR